MIFIEKSHETVPQKFVSLQLPRQRLANLSSSDDYGVAHSDAPLRAVDNDLPLRVTPGNERHRVQHQADHDDEARNELETRKINEDRQQQRSNRHRLDDRKGLIL